MKRINASNYSPPNVNYWGDRCCKAEAEIERLRAALNAMRAQFVKDRDAAQTEHCFGHASRIQTYINDVDRIHQQSAPSSESAKGT